MSASRETSERFADYAALVRKWNGHINLVASSTLPDFERRHIDDCRQLVDFAAPDTGHWVDLGSGGGLPGLIVSILTQDRDLTVTLVESDQRKSEFLRTAQRTLGLSRLSILPNRIEDIPPQDAAYISARALAPLPKLLSHVHRHLSPQGSAWLMKGRAWSSECDQARTEWRFDLQAFPSTTDPEAAILKISGVSHA